MQEKVLIIDDDKIVLNVTEELLRLSGYSTVSAGDGFAGIALASSERPDVIICDIVMPGINGYEVFNALSRNAFTAAIPFIFLTSKDNYDDQRKGMRMGASDYLTKPVNGIDLLESIEARIRKQRAAKKRTRPDGILMPPPPDPWKPLRELSSASTITCSRNDILFYEGDVQKHIFLVNKGRIKTMKINENGKRVITGFYSNADIVGCIAREDQAVYCDTAIAHEDAEVTRVPAEGFYSLIESDRDMMAALLTLMSREVSRKEKLMMNIALHSARRRMREALLVAAEYYSDSKSAGNSVCLSLSREDLANLAGLSTESAIRILSSFRKDGLLDADEKGQLIIHDAALLKKQKN